MGQTRLAQLLLRAAVAGAIAGGINASHCFATLDGLRWHITPAGAAHGAILAAISTIFSALAFERTIAVRLALWPITGWIGGYASMIPLSLSLGWIYGMKFDVWNTPEEAHWPFLFFGLVAAFTFLAWGVARQLRIPVLRSHVLYAVTAGVCGSLFWWLTKWSHWYYCIPHGICWGTAVGFAVWTVYRRRAPG